MCSHEKKLIRFIPVFRTYLLILRSKIINVTPFLLLCDRVG